MNPSSLTVTSLTVGQMAANCYLLTEGESRKTFIIDPGDDAEYIMDHLSQIQADPIAIVATHGHFDHVMAAAALQLAYTIPFLLHPADTFLIERMKETAEHFLGHKQVDPPPVIMPLAVDDPLMLGAIPLHIFLIPGHTPGSICMYDAQGNRAFVGDTIFAGGAVGRTDFSYSKPRQLASSIDKILALPPNTTLYAGHGEPTLVR